MTCPNYYQILPKPPNFSGKSIEEMYCIGLDGNGKNLTLNDWKKYWSNADNYHKSCTKVFKEKLYDINGDFSPSGFSETVTDFNFMFNSFFYNSQTDDGKGGHIIGVPGQKGYDDFSQILIDACSNNSQYGLQGVCQEVSNNMCGGCLYDNVTENKDLIKLCGCFVSSIPDTDTYKNIPKACDPLCSHEQVVKKRNNNTGVIDECNSSVCVINNINIITSKSLVGGSSFTQVCPQCTGTEVCKCIVDMTVPTIGNQIGITNNFNQYCGNNSICTEIDNNTGKEIIVDCGKNDTVPKEKITIPIWVWIICLIIVVIFILVVFVEIYRRRNEQSLLKKM